MKYKMTICLLLLIYTVTLSSCRPESEWPSIHGYDPSETNEPSTAIHTDDTVNDHDTVIVFADHVIERYTRKLLNKPYEAIRQEDVLSITVFGDMEGYGSVLGDIMEPISTLMDLQWFTNLNKLVLSRCKITDLSGIESLQNLQTLIVRENNIDNIEPIRELKNLVRLDCSDNAIKDISVVSGLVKLKELSIGGNKIKDLSPIRNLVELESLYAPWCGIEDISILSNMTELTYLQLYYNSINDIEALRFLTKLEYLELGRNQITDITPLEPLRNLWHINLRDNPILESDLEAYYQPKEDDFFVTTFHEKINEELPEFVFELLAYFDKHINGYSLVRLDIIDSITGERLQEISIPELSRFGYTNVSVYTENNMGLQLEDVNFDGYLDIRLEDIINGQHMEWIYLVWNPHEYAFEENIELTALQDAYFDQDKKLIYSSAKDSASDHWYYTYQYNGDDLVLIEWMSDNRVRFPEEVTDEQIAQIVPDYENSENFDFQYVVNKKLNPITNKLEVIDSWFTLYTRDGVEWVPMKQYKAGSAAAEALSMLIGW